MTKVAVVQAAAVPFNPQKTVDKAASIIKRLAKSGVKLAVFPEAFLGGYPKGSCFGSVVGNRSASGRALYQKYVDSTIQLHGAELKRLKKIAHKHHMIIVMGMIEKLQRTLYCTSIILRPDKTKIAIHRKLMPTGLERLIWGFGDGSTLPVVKTSIAKIGSVICWENYMPALRQAMYAQGIQIYCAPTADDRETWRHSMIHIALEGRVFVLSACQAIKLVEYPKYFRKQFTLPHKKQDYIMHGGSIIISPLGQVLAGPVYDCETELIVDIDLNQLKASNLDFDVAGHYSRPDIFHLQVNNHRLNPVSWATSQYKNH